MAAVSRFPKRPVAPPKKGLHPVIKYPLFVWLGLILFGAVMTVLDPDGVKARQKERDKIAPVENVAANNATAKAAMARVNAQACDRAKERLKAAKIGLELSDEARAAREAAREVVSDMGLQAGKDTSSQYWARVGAHAEVTEREKAVKEACK